MATTVQVVIACSDPGRPAEFWSQAPGYRMQDPPQRFATWPDSLRSVDVPESDWNSASSVVDPDGVGPRIFLQRVPEPISTKNRVDLDLNVSVATRFPLTSARHRLRRRWSA